MGVSDVNSVFLFFLPLHSPPLPSHMEHVFINVYYEILKANCIQKFYCQRKRKNSLEEIVYNFKIMEERRKKNEGK